MVTKKRAYYFILLSIIFSVFSDVTAKFLCSNLNVFQILFFRFFFSFIMLIPIARINKLSFDSVINIELNILRGILGFFGFAVFIYSFTILPLVDVVAISWSTPIFTFMLSSIILKEKPSKEVVFACIISIFAVAFMFLNQIDVCLISFLPLSAAFLFSLQDIMIKKMQKENEIVMLISFSLVVAMLSFPFAIYYWKKICFNDILLLVFLGFLNNTMQYFLIRSYQLSKLSSLTPLKYTEIILSALLGYLFFYEIPSFKTIIGSLVIAVATSIVLRNQFKKTDAILQNY